jgi:nitrogenase subunit NifH
MPRDEVGIGKACVTQNTLLGVSKTTLKIIHIGADNKGGRKIPHSENPSSEEY